MSQCTYRTFEHIDYHRLRRSSAPSCFQVDGVTPSVDPSNMKHQVSVAMAPSEHADTTKPEKYAATAGCDHHGKADPASLTRTDKILLIFFDFPQMHVCSKLATLFYSLFALFGIAFVSTTAVFLGQFLVIQHGPAYLSVFLFSLLSGCLYRLSLYSLFSLMHRPDNSSEVYSHKHRASMVTITIVTTLIMAALTLYSISVSFETTARLYGKQNNTGEAINMTTSPSPDNSLRAAATYYIKAPANGTTSKELNPDIHLARSIGMIWLIPAYAIIAWAACNYFYRIDPTIVEQSEFSTGKNPHLPRNTSNELTAGQCMKCILYWEQRRDQFKESLQQDEMWASLYTLTSIVCVLAFTAYVVDAEQVEDTITMVIKNYSTYGFRMLCAMVPSILTIAIIYCKFQLIKAARKTMKQQKEILRLYKHAGSGDVKGIINDWSPSIDLEMIFGLIEIELDSWTRYVGLQVLYWIISEFFMEIWKLKVELNLQEKA